MTFRNKYEEIRKSRETITYTEEEKKIIEEIIVQTQVGNRDNISRTHTYKEYYLRNPEIGWSFLASMVSRNAGWNMTDLEGKYYPNILSEKVRKRLFLTYERANWFIFSDAYPQLLVYEYSKRINRPLFHLLSAFYVSVFMEIEWERFWKNQERIRLVTALIINEQNMIQQPVIEHPYFQKHVFHSLLFKFQEVFHFSAVLFPTKAGKLYGFSVYDFEKLPKRIDLGKRLAWLLFHPDYYEQFSCFSNETVHTGSRIDYEQYFPFSKQQDTPYLRDVFPVIPHQRHSYTDWYKENLPIEEWFTFDIPKEQYDITEWFLVKQKQLHLLTAFNLLRTDE
ncbi:DUF2515 domain-containing protein [Microbacteriaceae bacterium 4G12]